MYLQNALILFILFAAFNAVMGNNFTLSALNLGDAEKKIVLTVPIAYVLIAVVFGGGFFATIFNILAFVLIYAKFTGRI
jgi:hypothetical protein